MKKKNLYLSVFFSLLLATALSAGPAQAQGKEEVPVMTGKVTDPFGNPLEGVVIRVPGSDRGALTDVDGMFTLRQDILITEVEYGFPGYKTFTAPLKNGDNGIIRMDPDAMASDEVVTLIADHRSRNSLTASVSTISGEELNKTPHMSLMSALAGRLPGLIVQQTGFVPGGETFSLSLRGSRTVNGQTPLVLVDGIPATDLNSVNPRDVESVSVLKDAAATALYGLQGGNGIISIVTKRGTFGAPRIMVDADYSFQAPLYEPERIHSGEFAELRNEAARNDGQGEYFYYTQDEIDKYRSGTDRELYPDTDWYDLFMRSNVQTQRVNVSASGGGNTVKYYSSIGYTHQGSPFEVAETDRYDPTRRMDRFNFRTNMDVKINSFISAYMNLSGRVQRERRPRAGTQAIYQSLFNMHPTVYGPLTPDGQVIASAQNKEPAYGQINRTGFLRSTGTTLDATLGLRVDLDFITKGLSTTAQASFDSRSLSNVTAKTDYERWERDLNNTTELVFRKTGDQVDAPLEYSKGVTDDYIYDYRWAVDYRRTFGDHSVGVSGFMKYQEESRKDEDIKGILPYIRMTYGGQVGYGYRNLLFADFAISYDGSEQFPPDKRYGAFPAVSAAWVISNHGFLKNNSWLTYLKLRASYGQVGSDKLRDKRYPYLENNKVGTTTWNSTYKNHVIEEYERGDPNIRWETSDLTNIGLEFSLWNQVTFGIDLFREKRHHIILLRNGLPSTYGIASQYFPSANIGKMDNRGFEIQLGYHRAFSKDFSLHFESHVGVNDNEIKFIDEIPFEEGYAYKYNSTGYRHGQQWGHLVDYSNGSGFFRSQEEIDALGLTYDGTAPRPGDLIFRDLNGDKIIDNKDRAPVGNAGLPKVEFGANLVLNWKRFDLSVFVQGLSGHSSIASGRGYNESENQGAFFYLHKQAWTPERAASGERILAPALSTSTSSSQRASDFYLRNNSFVRLRNVELGYTLPRHIIQALKGQLIRVYVSGQNLLTFDKLKKMHDGIDPEMGSPITYPAQRILNIGLKVTF